MPVVHTSSYHEANEPRIYLKAGDPAVAGLCSQTLLAVSKF